MNILVNNKPIYFDGEISFSIVNPLPMFGDEISASLQATAPDDANGVNRSIFGYINRVDVVDNKTRELNAVLEHGLWRSEGTIVVKYQNGSFPFYYKASGDFWAKIKNKMLKDLTYNTVDLAGLTDQQFKDLVNDYCRTDIERPFAFPTIFNKKVYDSFPVKFNHNGLVNQFTNHITISATNPVIPFLYLKEIYKAIFDRNGITIRENTFTKYPELDKIVLPNNYMVNEFEIDLTVQSTSVAMVRKIENRKDPLVTTAINHNLTNYQFISFSGIGYMASLVGKVYQAEVIDEKSFKLIGADTSNDPEFNCFYLIATQWIKNMDYSRLELHFEEDVPEFISSLVYLRSNDWNGLASATRARAASEEYDNKTVFIEFYDASILANHFFTQATILAQLSMPPETAGDINYLPATLINSFKKIDPRNHVPDIGVNEFLKNAFYIFGIFPFVNDQSQSVDIVSIRNIILDSNVVDISNVSGEVTDIENPEETDYVLQMQADSTDDYYKARLPKANLDDYTIKDAVATFADLPFEGSETNDTRLVTSENAYYSFSRSYLNAVNSWKFLTYNHLDKTSNANAADNQLLKHTTNFTTLLPEVIDAKTYASMQTAGESNSFLNVKTEIKPRILNYHGLIDRGYNNLPYASMGTTDETGNAIDGANLNLKWDGPNGLYEKYWKEYIHWRLNTYKQCQCLIQWPEHLIVNFRPWKKYRIRGVDYLVVKIPVVLGQDNRKIYSSKTELVRV